MNNIEQEIKKIVEYRNSTLIRSEQKSITEVENIINQIIDNFNKSTYDFSSYHNIVINQGNKKRSVKQYDEWSAELVLSIYLKRCLDKEFKIKYPNRNEHMHILFGIISAIKDMKDYVIVKFDFEDFFNSISSEYVFEKYIVHSKLQRFQKDLFKKFVANCSYCYAGISTSNIMAEIICRDFDQQVQTMFKNRGLIFYKRYVDDGILIFNRYIDEREVIDVLEKAIDNVFFDNSFNVTNECKTKLNKTDGKFTYISKRLIEINTTQKYEFNYLGYKFGLSAKLEGKNYITDVEYGITIDKIQKYTKKIAKIIDEYLKDKDIEFLRHRLRAFCCRTVYRRKYYKHMIWKAKGFISNYCELRYYLDNLDDDTESFLKNTIVDTFNSKIGYCPYFLKNEGNSPYSLYYSLEKNRTLLFEENERIGIGYNKLKMMCEQIGISGDIPYNGLLREYLIKIKVGH